MRLNHLNLPVENVALTRRFFEQFFGFKCVETKGDDLLSVLLDEAEFTLVLMAISFNRDDNTKYPDAHHIGFFVQTNDEVTACYDKLVDGGVSIARAPAKMRGVFGFYVYAPGNILIEVSCA